MVEVARRRRRRRHNTTRRHDDDVYRYEHPMRGQGARRITIDGARVRDRGVALRAPIAHDAHRDARQRGLGGARAHGWARGFAARVRRVARARRDARDVRDGCGIIIVIVDARVYGCRH